MSKDSSHTYIHFRASHHADLFEDFCHPPSSSNAPGTSNSTNPANTHANNNNNASTNTDPSDPSLAHIPGHFLPFESIVLPAHLMPLNPEDEDGVVPDMHAAFSISQAMGTAGGQGDANAGGRGAAFGRGEGIWRDFGLEGLVDGTQNLSVNANTGSKNGLVLRDGGSSRGQGVRREGVRHGILNVR